MILRTMLLILLTFSFLQSFSQAKQFKFGEERRRYLVYLPESYHQNNDKKFPLVFNFHGGGMTMTEHMFYTGMNTAADKHNFIVVYPQGIKQDWNVGFDMSYQNGTNDTGFVRALLLSLIKEYRINPAMVYATGLSRGGFFTQRLAAEMPELFAAIASVGGPLPDSVAYFHKKKIPVGAMIVHGSEDQIVNFEGKQDAYKSAFETYNYWKRTNSMEGYKEKIKTINRIKNDSTSVTITELWRNELGVSLVTIIGGGHTWPGTHPFNIGFSLGRTSQDIAVNEIMWKFFSLHSRKKSN